MNIYFAGSIRGGRDDQILYSEIIESLRRFGTVLTEHVGNLDISSLGEAESDKYIHDRDLKWLAVSDCVVAEVTTPSLGVGYEIAKATELRKYVLCIYRPASGRRVSAMIGGCENVMLCEYKNLADLNGVFASFFSSIGS